MVLIDLEFDPRCSQGLPGAGKFGIEGRLPVTGHRIPHLAQGVAGDVLDVADFMRCQPWRGFDQPPG